ncbi:putative gustatory receptor 58c [Drosophila busckii]|uniref:putative gustatory receptor 58c n=1 Tax=Drosophila busckii TaxID=30019 RepID=UPI00083EBD89|nr:putative gustatory receptor 58c [Drosophila busckii]
MDLVSVPIYITLARYIGLCNMHYTPELMRFDLDRGWRLAYCLAINLVYFLLSPCVCGVMAYTFFRCQDMDMLAVCYTVVAMANSAHLLLLLVSTWLRQYVVFVLVGTSNWILECMCLETQELRQDLRWLPRRYGRHRLVYQQQLLAGWQHLWSKVRRLDFMLQELRQVFQRVILLNLFSSYLSDIAVLFSLVVESLDRQFVNRPWLNLGHFIICIAHLADAMINFFIFHTNHSLWCKLSRQMQGFWFQLNFQGSAVVTSFRQLEFAVIFLNRKLQKNPRRVRPLHIVGLFDMNKEFCFNMLASIAVNVLILWQIAYKNYY